MKITPLTLLISFRSSNYEKCCWKIIFSAFIVLLFYGGLTQAGYIDIYEDTVITTDFYTNDYIRVFGAAKVDFYGYTAGQIDFLDTSTGSIYEGTIGGLGISDSAVAYLYGGTISVVTAFNTTVHLYGQDIVIEPYYTTGLYIHGLWADNTPFSFIAYRAIPYNSQFVIHDIPEPATIVFLMLGILCIRKIRG